MSAEPPRKHGGKFTQPEMPQRAVVRENGVTIEQFYCSGGDHGPPHLHVSGKGPKTRIGQKGHPLKGDPEPSSDQKQVINNNKAAIKKTLKRIGRWYYYENLLDTTTREE